MQPYNGIAMSQADLEGLVPPPGDTNHDPSDDNHRLQARDNLLQPAQRYLPSASSPTETFRDVIDQPPSPAAVAAASTLRSAFKSNADPSISTLTTTDSSKESQKLGESAYAAEKSAAPPLPPRDGQYGSPVAIPGSRRQGIVFSENVGDSSYETSASGASSISPSGYMPAGQQQRQISGSGVRPRTRTMDAAMLMQRSTPAASNQRHRVSSVSSTGSQPLLDDHRTAVSPVEIIAYSATAAGRLQEPATPSTPSRTKDKKSSKRLMKRHTSRPTSPIPAPSPSVDSFPLPISTPEPTKLIMLMKKLGGRMRGDIEYKQADGDQTWQRGIAYIDDEKACLMFNSGQAGPFFTTIISDLRGCSVLPVEHPNDGKDCLELLAAGATLTIYIRPLALQEWNLWLAAFLCWQQTRMFGTTTQNGTTINPVGGIVGSGVSKPGASADGSKTATIIKVGTIMLWDKGSTVSANDLVQRPSTRAFSSPSASWRRISTILHDNGELKLLVENEISSLCVIQLPQLSRCAIQQLDHTVLDEDFCIAIFPIYASTATRLSIFRPVYLALDSRVQFEVWFVLLRTFAVPDLYKLDARDRDSICEVTDLEDQGSAEETFRIEKTIGVRITEAKVKSRPSGLDVQAHEKSHKSDQDPLVGSYVAEVILDGEVRARTMTKLATRNPYWREDCEFADLPHTVQEVSVVLKRTDGTADPIAHTLVSGRLATKQEVLYGTVHIALDKLQRGKDHEDWLPILDDQQQSIGSMLIKVYHAEQVALLSKEYEPLSEILHRFPGGLTTLIAAALPGHLRRLSEIFLNIFQSSGNALSWLMGLVEDEIDGIGSSTTMKKFRFSSRLKSNESIESASERELLVRDMGRSLAGEANLLFRGNSLLTQSLEFHMRRLGVEYLEDVLRQKIVEINDINPDCEVDTSRLPNINGADLDQRWNRLIHHTTEVWHCIAESAQQLPTELRLVLKYIRAVAEDRYGDFLRTVSYTAVSGFLFLRFICPAILSPKLFGLLRDHPQPQAQRTLTLIAKVLQKMSNMSTFGRREEWMEPMNRFLTTQRTVFRDYIDQVCGIPADRDGLRSVPAAYSTPINMLSRLGPTAKEGFPSLPYLIDHARSFASLVRLWVDSRSEEAKVDLIDGELLVFHELCVGLQKRADACLAQVERTRSSNAATRDATEQLTQSLEQATLIESLSAPYVLPSVPNEYDRPPGSSGSDCADEHSPRRRSREWRRGRDGPEGRKASGLRQVSGMGSGTHKGRNGNVGRSILNGIMRIGGRAESPDAKSHR